MCIRDRSNSEIDLLAKKVFENWDYSEIYNTLLEDIYTYAQFNSIDLEGKDGVEAAWLHLLFVINLLQDTLEQVTMASNFSVLNVNQSVEFITLTSQD